MKAWRIRTCSLAMMLGKVVDIVSRELSRNVFGDQGRTAISHLDQLREEDEEGVGRKDVQSGLIGWVLRSAIPIIH